ncbi:hypothetical protein HY491_00325 [Candidatus Woesearchaeota archaeon]|nr:hypothetical protein [Candidatus Woesearchaeota archaeon]
MIDKRKAAALVKNLGIDVTFFGKLTPEQAVQYLEKQVRMMRGILHPDRGASSQKFVAYSELAEIVDALDPNEIHQACRMADSKKVQIAQLEKSLESEHRQTDQEVRNLLRRFVLNQYRQSLEDIAADKFLVLANPHSAYGNEHMLSTRVLFRSPWFTDKVRQENKMRLREGRRQADSEISTLLDSVSGVGERMKYYRSRIEEIKTQQRRMKRMSEAGLREYIHEHFTQALSHLKAGHEKGDELAREYEWYSGEIQYRERILESKGKTLGTGEMQKLEDEKNALLMQRRSIYRILMECVPFEVQDAFIDARALLKSEGSYIGSQAKRGELIAMFNGVCNRVIKKNNRRLKKAGEEINAKKRRIQEFRHARDSLAGKSYTHISPQSSAKEVFSFYVSHLNGAQRELFFARNWQRPGSGSDQLVFYPVSVVYIDARLTLWYHNMRGMGEDIPPQEQFQRTDRNLVAIVDHMTPFFSRGMGTAKMVTGQIDSQYGDVVPEEAIIESGTFKNFVTEAKRGALVLSSERVAGGLIYRVEGSVASRFFTDRDKPEVIPNIAISNYFR